MKHEIKKNTLQKERRIRPFYCKHEHRINSGIKAIKMKNKEEPVFTYGDGFTGRTAYVNGVEVYHGFGDIEEATQKAREYLKENNIEFEGPINFNWNGCM